MPEEKVKKLKLVELHSHRDSLSTQPTSQAPNPPVIHLFKGEKTEVRIAPRQSALVELPKPALLLGHPPKVVWVRLGNCSTAAVAALLRTRQADLLAFEADPTASFFALS